VLDARLRLVRGDDDFARMAQEYGVHRVTVRRAAVGERYRAIPMPPGPMWSVLR
jgi:hypothetical protein